eukprot:3790743-Rhodomonas_salina.1
MQTPLPAPEGPRSDARAEAPTPCSATFYGLLQQLSRVALPATPYTARTALPSESPTSSPVHTFR